MSVQDDDLLYDRLEKEWEQNGRPCPNCFLPMQYDFERSNKVTRSIPGNLYGTKEPLYRYYKCLKCGYEK